MGAAPLVSLIIPNLNRRKLLEEALQSIRAQTYTSWEAVVVDDASQDESADMVAQLATRDRRVRLVRRSGSAGGAQVCRNQGIAAARGDYVIYMDSDDLIAPHCLYHRVDEMERDKSLDFVVGGTECFDRVPGDGRPLNIEAEEVDLDRFLRCDCPWQTMGPLWRRESLRNIGTWDERLAVWQDVDYSCRALALGQNYRRVTGVDCYHRSAQGGRTTIGSQPRTEAWFMSQAERVFTTHRLMQESGTLTDVRRSLVLANCLSWAMEALNAGYPRTAMAIWSHGRTYGLTSRQLRQGRLLLRLSRTWLSPLIFHRLMADWSKEGLVRRWCVKDQDGRWVHVTVPVTDCRHSLQRFSGPLREGLAMYILRRLHPLRIIRVVLRDLGWRGASGRQAVVDLPAKVEGGELMPTPIAG